MANKFYVSLPYVYPVCPLNLDHAKMFVIADILARIAKSKGNEVYYPIASHYSGNTAQRIAKVFAEIGKAGKVSNSQKEVVDMYQKFYRTPQYITSEFNDPLKILEYFSQEIIFELKSLKVGCEYNNYYSTNSIEFETFVHAILDVYTDKKHIVKNEAGEWALDYENPKLKQAVVLQINETRFSQPFQRKNVLASLKNVRSDWCMLRDNGFGIYYGNGMIIDPMFDSELFTLFDLYIRAKGKQQINLGELKQLFRELFSALLGRKQRVSKIVSEILNWLPCDVFVCEEHLKNWLVKRITAENIVMNKAYRTSQYFILGMGLLDGKRMSAFRGHAILTKDLIREYGGTRTRLIILLLGGHPSKMYNYDKNLPNLATKLLESLENYLIFLVYKGGGSIRKRMKQDIRILDVKQRIDNNINEGYFRQVVMELCVILPKEFKSVTPMEATLLLEIYDYYLELLLPGCFDKFSSTNDQ